MQKLAGLFAKRVLTGPLPTGDTNILVGWAARRDTGCVVLAALVVLPVYAAFLETEARCLIFIFF
jgi:hypothetical protein